MFDRISESSIQPCQWSKVESFFKDRFQVDAKIEVSRCHVVKALSVVTEYHGTTVRATVMLHNTTD